MIRSVLNLDSRPLSVDPSSEFRWNLVGCHQSRDSRKRGGYATSCLFDAGLPPRQGGSRCRIACVRAINYLITRDHSRTPAPRFTMDGVDCRRSIADRHIENGRRGDMKGRTAVKEYLTPSARTLLLIASTLQLTACAVDDEKGRLPATGGLLLLSARNHDLIEATLDMRGVQLSSDSSVVTWSDSEARERGISGYTASSLQVPDGLRIRGAAPFDEGLSLLVTRGRDIGILSHHDDAANPRWIRTHRSDSLAAAAFVARNWWFATLDSSGVQVFRSDGRHVDSLSRVAIHRDTSLLRMRSRPVDVRLSISGNGYMVAVLSDSLLLQCESNGGQRWANARASSPHERLLTALSLDGKFLITTSLDNGPQRTAAVVDSTCTTLRSTPLPELMVPLGAFSKTLLVADFRQSRRLRFFTWEWAQREQHQQQR